MNHDDRNNRGGAHRSRSLVLGAGGPVGRAWQSGLIAGLIEREIDFGAASLIVGTSAGAVVGAQLALRQAFGEPPEIAAAIASAPPPVHSDGMADLGAAMARAAQSPEPELIRAEIGKMALNAQ